jgi:hypothetical protein
MDLAIVVLGTLLVGAGFVALVHRLHDRSFHDAVAVVREAHGDAARAIGGLATLIAPIVSSIAGGIALLALAVLSQART